MKINSSLYKLSFLCSCATTRKKELRGSFHGNREETTCSIQYFNDLNSNIHLIRVSVADEKTAFHKHSRHTVTYLVGLLTLLPRRLSAHETTEQTFCQLFLPSQKQVKTKLCRFDIISPAAQVEISAGTGH